MVQWNLSIMVTLQPDISGLYIQVAVLEKKLHIAVSSILMTMIVMNIKSLMLTLFVSIQKGQGENIGYSK